MIPMHNTTPTEASLIRRIKYSLKKRETRVFRDRELEGARTAAWQHVTDIVDHLARRSGSDWLYSESLGEANFFEGN